MKNRKSKAPQPKPQPAHRLEQWDAEGGAGPASLPGQPELDDAHPPTDAAWGQLRIRVIALENLVITLLAERSDRQLGLAREMASYISPRPGYTHHRLTLHAAAQMLHLVERAGHFGAVRP